MSRFREPRTERSDSPCALLGIDQPWVASIEIVLWEANQVTRIGGKQSCRLMRRPIIDLSWPRESQHPKFIGKKWHQLIQFCFKTFSCNELFCHFSVHAVHVVGQSRLPELLHRYERNFGTWRRRDRGCRRGWQVKVQKVPMQRS